MEALVKTPKKVREEQPLLVDEPVQFPVSKKWNLQSYEDLMSIKRVKERRERRETAMYFFLGLTLSLLMVIAAFEYKSYDKPELVLLEGTANEIEMMNEIPPTEQPPPPPPKQSIPQVITEVADDTEIVEDLQVEIDVEATENMAVEEVVYEEVALEEAEEEVEQIFNIVETYPEPVGGFEAFYKFVSENMKYPQAALRAGIGGRVFVQFVVEKDGSLTNFNVVKGIGFGCDEEAIRVLKMSPNWTVGKQRGKPVRVYKTLPIFFIYKENAR